MEELIEKFRYKKSKAAFAQSKIKYLERMDKIEDPNVDTKTFHAWFEPRVRGGMCIRSKRSYVLDMNRNTLCVRST